MDHPPALAGHSHETHIEGSGGAGHAGYGAYGIGFALSVILTVAAFYPVMVPGTLPAGWLLPTLATLAVVQIVVHLVCFLHMSAGSEQRWNVTAFGFALLPRLPGVPPGGGRAGRPPAPPPPPFPRCS